MSEMSLAHSRSMDPSPKGDRDIGLVVGAYDVAGSWLDNWDPREM